VLSSSPRSSTAYGVLFNRRMEQLATLAAHHALPAINPFREFSLAGGLMS
jgi:hypothetical protein